MGLNIHADVAQGTDAWFKLRREVPTASCFKSIITKTGKLAAARTGYMAQLLAEALCPEFAEDEINSPAIDWGNQWEPVAREEFAKKMGLDVREVAFVTTENGRAGCSPDGLIYTGTALTSGLEIKCPFHPRNHIATHAAGVIPPEHLPQVHGSMAVTGLDEWHFWSYFPGLTPFHQVIRRDDYTKKVEDALGTFATEYAAFRKRVLPTLEEGAE